MNLLARLLILIAAVAAICYWPNGLTMLALFLAPVAMVMIESKQPKAPRTKRTQ